MKYKNAKLSITAGAVILACSVAAVHAQDTQTGLNNVVLGPWAAGPGDGSVTGGRNAFGGGWNSVNIGSFATTTSAARDAVIIGQGGFGSAPYVTGVGTGVDLTGFRASGFGAGATSAHVDSAAIGSCSFTTRDYEVSFGGGACGVGTRLLANVTDGLLSTDAINKGQLDSSVSLLTTNINTAQTTANLAATSLTGAANDSVARAQIAAVVAAGSKDQIARDAAAAAQATADTASTALTGEANDRVARAAAASAQTSANTANNRLDSVDVVLTHHQTELTRIDNRVTALDERVTAIDGRLNALDAGLSALDSRMSRQLSAGVATALAASAAMPSGEGLAVGETSVSIAAANYSGHGAVAIAAAKKVLNYNGTQALIKGSFSYPGGGDRAGIALGIGWKF